MQRKLLIVTDEMETGGTQRQIVELARHIDRDAFRIEVVYFRNGSPYVEELRELGVDVTRIEKRWKVDLGFFLRLCRHLRRGEYDIVHGFSFGGEFWGWLANLFAGGARFVGSVRSIYEWYTPLQWSIKRIITLNSAALVANSHAGAEHAALQMGIRQSSVQVVHNGLALPGALDEIAARRAERGGEDFRVLFVGRLVDHKNVPALLRGFALLLKGAPQARLDIVGDGPERSALEAQVRELGIGDSVTLHGERQDVFAFLERADVFVCSSYREGLSNAIMEAMSAGLPVVASNVGGNSELIRHQETGLLFPNGDHESLAAALLELQADTVLRQRLGAAAAAAIRRQHDPRRMAVEMERIYARCLQEQGACVVER